MMHAHANACVAMPCPFPRPRRPLAREGKIMRESRQCTHIHIFFFLLPPPFCLIACYCTMEYYTPRDSRTVDSHDSESEFPWRGGA